MPRVLHPARSEFASLRTPLTPGEQRVIDVFDANLTPDWELYVQPHLNGLRPDLVLLHPRVGIAVFEVKDWDLDAMPYRVQRDGGRPTLFATNRDGRTFRPENPVSKVMLYQEEISSLYCPRLDPNEGIAVISAGLVFTQATCVRVASLLRPLRDCHEPIAKYPAYFPLAGSDDLSAGRLDRLFPEHSRRSSKLMTEETADDLRGWLREPDHSRQQRQPLELDARQLELVNTRTTSGYRRIKGPAGAGKSLVLAGRASQLASEGKRVLVVTFNITLKNYLRDLAVRHGPGGPAATKQIDFLNFHYWCKRVCSQAGRLEDYRALWSRGGPGDDSDNVLNEELAALVADVVKSDSGELVTRYDAIVVDEGQDFRLSWWNALRLVLQDNGEMLLAADKSQDIYATASAWTEDAMSGAGFSGGRWAELKTSYRLPSPIVPFVSQFAAQYMTVHEVDLPVAIKSPEQMELADLSTRLRWVQVSDPDQAVARVAEEVPEMMKRLTDTTSVSDIVLLLPTQQLGESIAHELKSRYGIELHHTFDADKRVARKKKLAFFKGDARVKATTLHSFKGWESRHLIVLVDSIDRPDSAALLYTAMTRLRRDPAGSCLTVVSACSELYSFGKTWPEFAVR
jgi:hypothetical protein